MEFASATTAIDRAHASLQEPMADLPPDGKLQTRQAFQDFVAGTFYKEMFKAIRKSQDRPAYFHGGRAEEVFQGQMDQHVAEGLAHDRGAEFAEPLFNAFQRRL